MKPCKGRHHAYKGDSCTKCGAPKRSPGRPKIGQSVAARMATTLGVATTADPSTMPQATSTEAPAATTGTASPVVAAAQSTTPSAAPTETKPTGATPDDTSTPAPPAEPTGWCKQAGKRLAKLFVVSTEWAIEQFDRIPGEPDEDDVDEFGRAMGRQMAVWFPDTALTPGKQLIIAGAFIAAEMGATSKKLPPPAKPRQLASVSPLPRSESPAPAPAAAGMSGETSRSD